MVNRSSKKKSPSKASLKNAAAVLGRRGGLKGEGKDIQRPRSPVGGNDVDCGVKCTGLVLFVGVDYSEAIELSEKCGEECSSLVLSRSVVTTLPSCFASSCNVSHLCYIFPLMPDNKRLLELALKGLQAERSRINEEITELTSLRMQGVGKRRNSAKYAN